MSHMNNTEICVLSNSAIIKMRGKIDSRSVYSLEGQWHSAVTELHSLTFI